MDDCPPAAGCRPCAFPARLRRLKALRQIPTKAQHANRRPVQCWQISREEPNESVRGQNLGQSGIRSSPRTSIADSPADSACRIGAGGISESIPRQTTRSAHPRILCRLQGTAPQDPSSKTCPLNRDRNRLEPLGISTPRRRWSGDSPNESIAARTSARLKRGFRQETLSANSRRSL